VSRFNIGDHVVAAQIADSIGGGFSRGVMATALGWAADGVLCECFTGDARGFVPTTDDGAGVDHVVAALRYLESGRHIGKVVVRVTGSDFRSWCLSNYTAPGLRTPNGSTSSPT
jgi:hypothetical protein